MFGICMPTHSYISREQADPRFHGRSALFVFRTTVKQEGLMSLYRGFLPPLIGGSCFCSAVFGSYSSTFAACEGTILMDPILGTHLRPAVLLASGAAAASRSMIETPFELLKTRMQLGKEWRVAPGFTGHNSKTFSFSQLRECYRGLRVTFCRNVLLLGTMFSVMDSSTRVAPGLASTPLAGPFFQGAVCNTIGWFVAWPFELLKSKVQGDTTGLLHRKSLFSLFAQVFRSDGVRGLWRGYALGGTRSFVVNGCSMVAYQWMLNLRRKQQA